MNEAELKAEIELCKTRILSGISAYKSLPTPTSAQLLLVTEYCEGWNLRRRLAQVQLEAL